MCILKRMHFEVEGVINHQILLIKKSIENDLWILKSKVTGDPDQDHIQGYTVNIKKRLSGFIRKW